MYNNHHLDIATQFPLFIQFFCLSWIESHKVQSNSWHLFNFLKVPQKIQVGDEKYPEISICKLILMSFVTKILDLKIQALFVFLNEWSTWNRCVRFSLQWRGSLIFFLAILMCNPIIYVLFKSRQFFLFCFITWLGNKFIRINLSFEIECRTSGGRLELQNASL